MIKTNRYLIISLMGFLLLTSFAHARNSGVWIDGQVTTTPYVENDRQYVGVNDKIYWILPDTNVSLRYEWEPGKWAKEESSVSQISRGQQIMIKANQNEINKIILF